MSMKRNIVIDGQEVPFKASAAIPRIYRMRFHRDIYKDLRDLEKGSIRTTRRILTWIYSLWKCLRISLMSWQSTPTRPSRIRRRNGWMGSTPFPSIRYCPRSLNCGG